MFADDDEFEQFVRHEALNKGKTYAQLKKEIADRQKTKGQKDALKQQVNLKQLKQNVSKDAAGKDATPKTETLMQKEERQRQSDARKQETMEQKVESARAQQKKKEDMIRGHEEQASGLG
jgi:hypothetical protein